jgi:hypothetical protein
MKHEIVMVRDGGCLRPYGEVSWDAFDSVRTSKPVIVTIHQARNPEHHNKIWAIAAKVADHDDDFIDAEAAMEYAKGNIPDMHTKEWKVLPNGTLICTVKLKSICWASMDQIRFNRFYDLALALWAEKIGTDPETLLEQVAA